PSSGPAIGPAASKIGVDRRACLAAFFGQHGFQRLVLPTPLECKLQTEVTRQRFLRLFHRPGHRETVRTHARRQTHAVNHPGFDVFECIPHKISVSVSIPQSHQGRGGLQAIPTRPRAARVAVWGTASPVTTGSVAAAWTMLYP